MYANALARLLAPGIAVQRRLRIRGKWLLLGVTQALFLAVSIVVAGDVLAGLDKTALSAMAILLALQVYAAAAVAVSVAGELRRIDDALDQAAHGDLTVSVDCGGKDELHEVAEGLSTLTQSISASVAQVRSGAAMVAQAGQTMLEVNRSMSARTEQEAASLEETNASVQEISSTVARNAETARNTDRAAARLREVAQNGADAMTRAVNAVEAVQASASRMREITSVIDSLAFQTNILALNAAVEAARAGEHGRGFAVVAAEVRELAQRSAASAREIHQLIGTSIQQVEASGTQMRTAREGIDEIVAGVATVADAMSAISEASADQVRGLSEIAAAIRDIDGITQRNAQMAEQTVAHATELRARASQLSESVGRFKLQQGSADEAIALVNRAVELWGTTRGQAFLDTITDKQNGFFDRDLYVFALDVGGAYLAFGGNQSKVGTRVQDLPGTDGAGLLEAIVNQAELGPGWVEYEIANPKTGKINAKMSYVLKLGEYYVGCGIYKNVMS